MDFLHTDEFDKFVLLPLSSPLATLFLAIAYINDWEIIDVGLVLRIEVNDLAILLKFYMKYW